MIAFGVLMHSDHERVDVFFTAITFPLIVTRAGSALENEVMKVGSHSFLSHARGSGKVKVDKGDT